MTSGEVVTRRSARRRRPAARSSRMRPKPSWVDIAGAAGTGSASGTAIGAACSRRGPSARTARRRGRRGTLRRRCRDPPPAPIPRPRRMPIAVAQGLHLGDGHQAGMVVLVAGERQAEALDRVGDEAGRPVVGGRLLERLEQRRHVVAGEVGHQPRRARRRERRSISRVTGPWSPMSSRRCLRQAAPPLKVSAE